MTGSRLGADRVHVGRRPGTKQPQRRSSDPGGGITDANRPETVWTPPEDLRDVGPRTRVELRLQDGEVVTGRIVEWEADVLSLDQGARDRPIRLADVQAYRERPDSAKWGWFLLGAVVDAVVISSVRNIKAGS